MVDARNDQYNSKIVSLTQDIINVLQEVPSNEAAHVLSSALISIMVNIEIVYQLAKDNKVIDPSDLSTLGLPDFKKILIAREVTKRSKKLCDVIEDVVQQKFVESAMKYRSSEMVLALALFINDVINTGAEMSEDKSEDREDKKED